MKVDFHVHSSFSQDGKLEAREILSILKARGLTAVAIMDHNSIQGSLIALKEAKDTGMIVIRGTEVSSTLGHIGALGIDQDIPRGLTPEETVERIHSIGGIAIAVHPFRLSTGIGGDIVKRCKFDAVEVLNGWTTRNQNARALEIARKLDLGCTAGSDGHRNFDIGKAYGILDDCETEDQIIDAILHKRVKPEGEARKTGEFVRDAIEMTIDWMRRGFKRL